MKAKYKIGTALKWKSEQNEGFGEIQGVITRKTGYEYLVTQEGVEYTVAESDVLCAFREVTSKKSTTKRKPKAVTKEAA